MVFADGRPIEAWHSIWFRFLSPSGIPPCKSYGAGHQMVVACDTAPAVAVIATVELPAGVLAADVIEAGVLAIEPEEAPEHIREDWIELIVSIEIDQLGHVCRETKAVNERAKLPCHH
jgi:hypothetical protein